MASRTKVLDGMKLVLISAEGRWQLLCCVSRAEGNGGKAGSYLPRRIEQQPGICPVVSPVLSDVEDQREIFRKIILLVLEVLLERPTAWDEAALLCGNAFPAIRYELYENESGLIGKVRE